MFTVSGESQVEQFEYSTTATTFQLRLRKFTKWLKNKVIFPEVTNNISSFVLEQNIIILDCPPAPNNFLKKNIKREKNHIVIISH